MTHTLLDKLAAAPRRMFLIDGCGAALSAIMLGGVWVSFPSFVGMPAPTLRALASVAALFALFSLTCARYLPSRWRSMLLGLAGANLSYCVATAGVVIANAATMRPVGWAYFVVELFIIARLATLEMAVARRL